MRSFMTMKGYGALMSLVEVWKDIEDYEGLYQVSNLGRARSLERVDSNGHRLKGKVLAYNLSVAGYLNVCLCRDGKAERKLVHRLVATAFLDNPDNFPQVNHKDENKENNRVENLEWCDSKYNANYGSRNERVAKANERPIYVVTSSGHRYYFSGIKKAAELLGLDRRTVSRCLRGRQKHHHGFSFMWAV